MHKDAKMNVNLEHTYPHCGCVLTNTEPIERLIVCDFHKHACERSCEEEEK